MLIIGFLSIFRSLLCDLAECRRVKAGFAQPPSCLFPGIRELNLMRVSGEFGGSIGRQLRRVEIWVYGGRGSRKVSSRRGPGGSAMPGNEDAGIEPRGE